MKHSKILWLVAIAAGLLILTSCGLMSAEQQQTSIQVVDDMLKNGSVTQAQHDAMVEAILQSGSINWLAQAGTMLSGAALGYFGVMKRRGAVTQDVGIPEAKIKKA